MCFSFHSGINKYRSVANFGSMTSTGKGNCQPEHCMSECITWKTVSPCVTLFNQSQEAMGEEYGAA